MHFRPDEENGSKNVTPDPTKIGQTYVWPFLIQVSAFLLALHILGKAIRATTTKIGNGSVSKQPKKPSANAFRVRAVIVRVVTYEF